MSPATPQRIRCAEVPDLPAASWTNAWKIGDEVVMSGMTGPLPELLVEIDGWTWTCAMRPWPGWFERAIVSFGLSLAPALACRSIGSVRTV